MKIFLMIALLVAASDIVRAQPNDEGTAKTEITKANREWIDGIIQRDSVALDNVLDPELTLNGDLARSAWIKNTLHHITTSALRNIGEPEIVIYGASAVSTSRLYWKASFDGREAIDGEFLVTDIWKKNNGRWQVLIRMSKRQ